MEKKRTSNCRGTLFPREGQQDIRLFFRNGASSASRPAQIVIALLVMAAIATALIAPSIDMPDTVLLDHHIAAHAARAHSSGNLTISAIADFSYSYQSMDSLHRMVNGPLLNRGFSQQSLVLRC